MSVRPYLFAALSLFVGASCTDARPPTATMPTTVAPPQADVTAPSVRTLSGPQDVEQLIQEFGNCVVARSPAGVGLAIWFDRATGLVGSTLQVSANSEAARQLDEAVFQCDAELAYRSSINAYIDANPLQGELGPNGLPTDRGEQLRFGDHSFNIPTAAGN